MSCRFARLPVTQHHNRVVPENAEAKALSPLKEGFAHEIPG